MSQANLQELTEAKAEADEGRKGKAFNRPRENEAGGEEFQRNSSSSLSKREQGKSTRTLRTE